MKTFIPGQIASAADVNQNFTELADRATALETKTAPLETTDWEPIPLSPGWAPTVGHTPMIRLLGGIVCIEGAVTRQSGGDVSNMATIPKKYRPSKGTQFIGSATMLNGASKGTCELFIEAPTGHLRSDTYTTISTAAGWVIPLSCTFARR